MTIVRYARQMGLHRPHLAGVLGGLLAVPVLGATTTLTGSHDNQSAYGYEATSGSIDVPGTPGTTFNDNGFAGLVATVNVTSVTIEGGQFNDNPVGFYDEAAIASISGGQFDNNSSRGILADDNLDITGGSIDGNTGFGLVAYAHTTIEGGDFNNPAALADITASNGASIDLYGSFIGLLPGQTEALPVGNSTITGTLEDDAASQSIRAFNGEGASITLHDVAVPEPASAGAIGLAVVMVAQRRRRTPPSP